MIELHISVQERGVVGLLATSHLFNGRQSLVVQDLRVQCLRLGALAQSDRDWLQQLLLAALAASGARVRARILSRVVRFLLADDYTVVDADGRRGQLR